MNTRIVNNSFVSIAELKTNLRIVDDESFDSELRLKLNAAVTSASKFIGHDLTTIEQFSCAYASDVIEFKLPTVYRICQIEIGTRILTRSEWAYGGDKLHIYVTDPSFIGQDVKISVNYNDDIKIAVLMHASSLFENPVDFVEQLPKASQNLLRPYRYGR